MDCRPQVRQREWGQKSRDETRQVRRSQCSKELQPEGSGEAVGGWSLTQSCSRGEGQAVAW